MFRDTLVTPSRKHQDWFDDQDAEIPNRLEAKHQLFIISLNRIQPQREMLALKLSKTVRDPRRMQNDWFRNKSEDIERHAASNNSKEFYRSLNAIYDRQPSARSAPMMDAKGNISSLTPGKVGG